MRPERAIYILCLMIGQDAESGRPDCVEAERLSIEAIKRLQELRSRGHHRALAPLPGETSE
jgi:hypothetical protein